jgi:hypothetical protein
MLLRLPLLGIALALVLATGADAQTVTAEQQVMQLSRTKWQWMADKAVDKLEPLFHESARFVHMSGTWKKDRELEIIKTGSIWYKQADVHDVAASVVNDTVVVWSRITLTAEVRGADAKNEFTVTEVFQKVENDWKLRVLTFSSVRPEHQLQK